jgi:hypothetical protein
MSQGQAVLAQSSSGSATRVAAHAAAPPGAVWGVLFLRPALALVAQVLVAGAFLLGGAQDPWRLAADWWLAWFGVVSIVNLGVLRLLLHREGRRLRDLYRFERVDRRTDLGWAAAALVISGPVAMLPNLLLGGALWGEAATTGAELSFRALPVLAAVLLVITFPLIHAMAELPTYFGYVMPRLAAITGWRWRAMLVAALVLSTQHVFLPLLLDWRFVVWRALMFLPFAAWIGFVVMRRPTALPYLVVGHALIDLSLPILVLFASL